MHRLAYKNIGHELLKILGSRFKKKTNSRFAIIHRAKYNEMVLKESIILISVINGL